MLIALRSSSKKLNHPGTWSTWGGAIDPGESQADAIKRELEEEAGYSGKITKLVPWATTEIDGVRYSSYFAVVPNEFNPMLNWENSNYRWVRYAELKALDPKHPGMRLLLKKHRRKLKEMYRQYVPKPRKTWLSGMRRGDISESIRLKIMEMAAKEAPRGLPMGIDDKERRAAAQGYSRDVWYHGSKSQTLFTEWKIDDAHIRSAGGTSHGGGNNNLYGPGVYLAKEKSVSASYAKSVPALRGAEKSMSMGEFFRNMNKLASISGGQAARNKALQDFKERMTGIVLHVRMFRVRVRKSFDCMRPFRPTAAEKELIKKYGYPMPDGRRYGSDVYKWWFDHIKDKTKINSLLRKMGYDSITHVGNQDSQVLIVFDPGDIRDVDAAYDPARIGENNSVC